MIDYNFQVYKNKILAFIDIMGFKEHIKASQSDFIHAIKIIELLEIFDEERERAKWHDRSKDWPNVTFTMFSDSIVISYDYEKDNPYVNLYSLFLDYYSQQQYLVDLLYEEQLQ